MLIVIFSLLAPALRYYTFRPSKDTYLPRFLLSRFLVTVGIWHRSFRDEGLLARLMGRIYPSQWGKNDEASKDSPSNVT